MKKKNFAARVSAAFAVIIAGYFGINPPGFVAQVVAFAFRLASRIFPALFLGIFDKRMNKRGGNRNVMWTHLPLGISCISNLFPSQNNSSHWLFEFLLKVLAL